MPSLKSLAFSIDEILTFKQTIDMEIDVEQEYI